MTLIIKAFILGIIEGLTEFLPVSSTGHLIIASDFLHFSGSYANMFLIVIQLGAILAVIYYYREKIIDSLKHLKPGDWGFNLWLKMVIAFIPAGIVGFLFNKYINKYLFSSLTVAIALVIGAIMMIIVENAFGKYKIDDMDKVSTRGSFWIGVAQVMSLFPGMSRSASTIMGGMMVGLSVKAAAEFSFFLSIPTMIIATGYDLLKNLTGITLIEWEALAVGFIMSFIVALIVIDKFLTYLRSHPLRPFAYYRLIVGIIMIGLVLTNLVK